MRLVFGLAFLLAPTAWLTWDMVRNVGWRGAVGIWGVVALVLASMAFGGLLLTGRWP